MAMTCVFFLGFEGVKGGMCGDSGLVTMGTASEGGRERRAERYVMFVPGKGTRSWGINLHWVSAWLLIAQWSKMKEPHWQSGRRTNSLSSINLCGIFNRG